MNKDEDYASSDSSDEDFCPDRVVRAADDSDACSSAGEEEEDDDEIDSGAEQKEQPQKSTKRLKKTLKPRKKPSAAVAVEAHKPNERRSTRQAAGELENGRKNTSLEKDEIESDEDDKNKSHSDALWADFLSDVKPAAVPKKPANGDVNSPTSKAETRPEPKRRHVNRSETSDDSASSSSVKDTPRTQQPKSPTMVTVTEVLDFAGEEVRVEKTIRAPINKDRKAPASLLSPLGLKRPAGAAAAGSGLGSLLSSMGKKKKISVLDKSKMDWTDFKQVEGIDEEIQTHNRGKDGYLERQDFLQRTDLRQFEIERNLRQSARRNN